MSSDAPAPPPDRRIGRGLLVVLWTILLLSLLANAFFAGVFIRHGWRFSQSPRMHVEDLGLGPRVLWREMDPSTRRIVTQQLRKHRSDIEGRMADIVKVRQDVLAAMKADPFDPKAYRAALERSADIDAKSRQDAINFFVDVVSQMSPAERKAVAARMERGVDAFGGMHRPHRQRPNGGFGPPGPPRGPFGPPQGQTMPARPAAPPQSAP